MKKEIPLKFEEKDYLCKLESTDSNLINVILSRDSLPEYKGNIALNNIYEQIRAFNGYTMEEIFSAINDIPQEKYNLTKKSDKLEFDIPFIVIKKEKHLLISLNEVTETNADIIERLMEISKNQKERIKALEEAINDLKIGKVKKKEKKEKEIQKKDPNAIDISEYIREIEIEGVNSGSNSLLILQDGRISLGTSKTYEHEK